jgi:hypothetical protein
MPQFTTNRGRLLRDHTISVGGVQGRWIRDLGAAACYLHGHHHSLATPRPSITGTPLRPDSDLHPSLPYFPTSS